ncbi:hypothetical protein KKG45_00980 [bacterium]|nr:hypothetical protein [bacterium]
MPKRALIGLTAAIILAASATIALAGTIPVNGTTSSIELIDQKAGGLQYHVRVGDIQTIDVSTKGGEFTRLVLPGFHATHDEGAPELPMINTLIAVPHGAVARVELSNVETRTVRLADFGIAGRLMPAQPSMPKNADAQSWPFVYDESAYTVDRVGRDLAAVAPQGRLRAMDFVRLEFAPVSYRPLTGELEIVESADLEVVYEGGDKSSGADLWARTDSPFFDNLYAQFDGAKGLHDSFPDHVRDVVTMVIVTPPEFQYQLTDFVNWKIQRGFIMIVAVTDTPEVGSTTTTIQSYIHDLYDNATPAQPAPSFVLFVGDVAQMPTFTVSGDATDRPYCAVDGDYVPDIYYGRFSCTNATQLQAMIDKTMMYDQFTMPDPSYLGEVTMIAGVDAGYAPTYGNGQINYGTNTYFNAAHGITSNTWLYPASDGAGVPAAVVQTVNDGVAYINYTAHGSETSWSDPSFTQSNINSLTNDGKYCMAVGNCCLTSTYDYGECFAETWLRAANKGAIGYIGASNSTLWDEDYWWGVGSGSISSSPTYAVTGLGAYDGVFHDHGEGMDQWYVTNDAMVFAGNLAVQEAGSGSTSYYWNIYNLMGDPSLSTYMGVPAPNAVTVDAMGATSITISAVPGSYVGLTQGTILIGAGSVGVSGSATIDFMTTPDGGLPLHMVVTAQNREPHVEDILMASPQIDLSVTTCAATLEPGQLDTDVLTITNTGEPESQLNFSLSIQAENPYEKTAKSVAGSTVSCAETEFLAGETVDLHISVYNASTDYEWLTDVEIDFPVGVTVNSATALTGGTAPLSFNGPTGDGVTVNWHGNDGSWGALHGGETANGTVNVTFGGSLSGEQAFGWFIQGDIYGSTPHDLSGSFAMTASGPSVTVTQPNGGETMAWGYAHPVTWDHAGDVTDVKIELSRNGGGSWETLVASTPNDGDESVVFPGPSTTAALIRVSSLDDTVADQSNAVFTLFEMVTWLTLDVESGTLPQGGNQPVTLTYDATGLADGVYTAYVLIAHNAGGGPEVVTVTLTVESSTGAGDTPRTLVLAGNYPNPFNPSTKVIFSLPRAGEVDLDVVDVRGHLVRALHSGPMAAGRHGVAWDGTDDLGHGVASGVYFARLRHDGRELTHKMLLTK